MKKLLLIGGTMGVGKTTVCQVLKNKIDHSVFLDGDWCWDTHPFLVNDETKAMVLDNICYLLNNFIHCSVYETVIFCWVMHEQSIIDEILSKVDISHCEVKIISLVCSEQALRNRLEKDICSGVREPDIVEKSLKRRSCYEVLNTKKLDVSQISPQAAAEIIMTM